MPRSSYSCLGDVTDTQLDAAADVSRQVRADQFPEIEWEHSHGVRPAEGLTSYRVYAAATAQRVRDPRRGGGSAR